MTLSKKTLGTLFIFAAAVCIMLSILFMFNVLPFQLPYTVAAGGFLLYVVGIFLSREGKLTPYKIAMVALAVLLIFLAITREVIGR
jgi:hypothetical protein